MKIKALSLAIVLCFGIPAPAMAGLGDIVSSVVKKIGGFLGLIDENDKGNAQDGLKQARQTGGFTASDDGRYGNGTSEFKRMTKHIVESSRVANGQTANSATEITAGIEKATDEKQAIELGLSQAQSIKTAIDDNTLGKGITGSFTCHVFTQNKEQDNRIKASQARANAYMQIMNAKQAVSSKERLADRTLRHRALYCGQAEVKHENCLYSAKLKPLQDTQFSTLMLDTALQASEIESALDFVDNVISVTKNTPNYCDTVLCRTLKQRELEYNAMASGVQSVFIHQITARSDIDTPMRTLINEKIMLDSNMASGDNWLVEQGTRYPSNSHTGTGGNTNINNSKNLVFIGDDIAKTYANLFNANYTGKHNPADVLEYIQNLKPTDGNRIFIVSLGYINMTDKGQRVKIIESIGALKALKSDVIVLGLPKSLSSENDWLRNQAITAGFSYNGAFSSDDGKTPSNPSKHDIKGLL